MFKTQAMKEQQFDKIISEIVKHEELESPSVNFMANLMNQIESEKITIVHETKKEYKLINAKGWVIPALVFISIFILAYLTTPETNTLTNLFQEIPKIKLPEFNLNFNRFQDLGLSSLLFYGSILGASIFILSIFDQVLSKKKTFYN